jgi:ring-1,2-phenylacetyl-CoA epoxidase subunit PaaD
MVTTTPVEAELLELAGSVPDPEMPMLTLAELGVVRAVHLLGPDSAEVDLTPTYTGCPAVEAMAADIERVLHAHGLREVTVRKVLTPAWSTDDITAEGRRKLRESGIAPPAEGARGDEDPNSGDPARGGSARGGPVMVPLGLTRTTAPPQPRCPHCGSADTELLSRFSSTACKALRRCLACREPFDHFKEL